MKGQQFCDAFSIPPEQGGKCIIIEVKPKGGQEKIRGACLVPVNRKVDLYGCVKPHFGAKAVSFLGYEETLEVTQMEYGSITPIGLPQSWPLLIDQVLVNSNVVIGSGKRSSKLYLSGKLLVEHTGGMSLEGLCR